MSYKKSKRTVLLELENIAFNSREIIYNTLKKELSKSVKMTPVLFSKYYLNTSIENSLHSLVEFLGKKGQKESKLLANIISKIESSLLEEKINSGFKKVLKVTAEYNVLIGVLSGLKDTLASQIAKKAGLSEENSFLHSSKNQNFKRMDTWLSFAKRISVIPAGCIVLATTSKSCKAATSCGMKCIAIPDRFTSFQDFSGADYVVDSINDVVIQDIKTILEAS